MYTTATKPKQPTIVGDVCVLVPYLPEHVPVYHQWMQRQQLLELTASERLTLQQEYDNQISWTQDASKVTFIILDRSLPPLSSPFTAGGRMCGDVNLFLHSYLQPMGELEVMVAEEESRRKGIAAEAVTLMMRYAAQLYGVHAFVVKIAGGNEASMRLFRDRLGFSVTQHVDVFDEYELLSPPCTCQQCTA